MNSNMKNAPKLRKSLSSVDIFLISFTGMVGSGWLLGVLAGPAYAGPASIITWVVAGLFLLSLPWYSVSLVQCFHIPARL